MAGTEKVRHIWVDGVKLFACFLVVLGHLYMSMEVSGWIQSEEIYYCLPIQTIYTFHVPLFFVCSGFLYQSKKTEYTLSEHIKTIKEKALILGIPYFVFSFITLMLKVVFSTDVNNQAPPIIKTLFLEPIAPYWYLHTLFLLFCLIPRIKKEKTLKVMFVISVLIKTIYVAVPWSFDFPDIIRKLASNAVWFLLGMVLTQEEVRKKLQCKWSALLSFVLGLIISSIYYRKNNFSQMLQFVVAVLFVYSLLSSFLNLKYEKVGGMISRMTQYFMPVYLMHTIFAAGIRILLLKIGIDTLIPQFTVGLIASIIFPILVYEIAKRYWFLLFWIEPSKALRLRENNNV